MPLRRWMLTAALTLALPQTAHAVFQTFTDRAAWEAAVASAGMVVETNDFTTDPGFAFTLGGADMTRTLGTHNAANGWFEAQVLRFGFVGGGPLYGLALDYNAPGVGAGNGLVRTRDENGLLGSQLWSSSTSDTFAGVLSDVPLSDVCGNFITCPGFGQDEIYLSAAPNAMAYVDNLSVAVMAPSAVVPALPAWGFRLLALVLVGLPLLRLGGGLTRRGGAA